jgi:hypothetical protein
MALVVVEIGDRSAALLVDAVLGQCDVRRRPADEYLRACGPYAGSGVLEDGSLVLIPRWAEVLRTKAAPCRMTQRPRDATPHRATVLVVDDSPIMGDGEEALLKLRAQAFNLVVTDLEMPRMDGLGLLEVIRRTYDQLPVIMLTTRSSPEDRRRAAMLGANAYVIKSEFQGTTLIDLVKRYVELQGA